MTGSTSTIGLVIIGASGRMGASLLRLLPEFPSIRLRAALCSPASHAQGSDCGELAGLAATGIPVTAHLPEALQGAGLALDFSAPIAAAGHVRQCAAAGTPLLLGTTGLGPDLAGIVEVAARHIPVLVAPNTSLGGSVLMGLVRRAAAALGEGYEVRIRDVHHQGKRDAPSGTALALGAAVQEGSRGRLRKVDHSSLREGDVAGHHEVQFQAADECLCLSHVATDRALFARGALRAGLWLVRQAPGRYDMTDIFEEK